MRRALLALVFAAGACSSPASELPLLGQIEDRDHVLLLHGNDRYTVKAKDGTVLAAEIDALVLARDYPELFDLVTDAPGEKTVEVFY